MKDDNESKIYYVEELTQENRAEWIKGLNASGYAGIDKKGQIVDRRQYPNAVPIKENSKFGIVKPKP